MDDEELEDYNPEEESRWTSQKVNELDVSDLLNPNNPQFFDETIIKQIANRIVGAHMVDILD